MTDRSVNSVQRVAYWLAVASCVFDYVRRMTVLLQSESVSWPAVIFLSVFTAIWLFLLTACLWGNRFAAWFLCGVGAFAFLGVLLYMAVAATDDLWLWVVGVAVTSLVYFVLGFSTLRRARPA